jgi:two-component system, OmpR family, sensor histidine kinase MtrB
VQSDEPVVSHSLEPELRLAAQMQALMRLQSGLAHDLKSPLNSMVLNLELLKRSIHAADPEAVRPRQERWIALLETELRRLQTSLELVLVELAPPSQRRESFDLRQLLGELDELLGPQARQQRVSLQVTEPPQEVPVRAQRGELRRAMLAMAAELLTGLGQGSELHLTAAADEGRALLRLRLARSPAGDESPTAPTPRPEGSGEGLAAALAREIASEHGGDAGLAFSAVGETTFVLSLPLQSAGS